MSRATKAIKVLFWLKVADLGNRMLWASSRRIRDITNPWGGVANTPRKQQPDSAPIFVTEWQPRERVGMD